ncbi:MAG: hypothetical protein ACI4OH_05165 [Mitsuokella sp.]|uniref:hypothetical protein n=1 Tax=Mitsuokella sp. TaxID=2049034 RepID=UPI003F0C4349
MSKIFEDIKQEAKVQAKLEDAVEMLKEKFSIEQIVRITKLSKSEIIEIGRRNGLL